MRRGGATAPLPLVLNREIKALVVSAHRRVLDLHLGDEFIQRPGPRILVVLLQLFPQLGRHGHGTHAGLQFLDDRPGRGRGDEHGMPGTHLHDRKTQFLEGRHVRESRRAPIDRHRQAENVRVLQALARHAERGEIDVDVAGIQGNAGRITALERDHRHVDVSGLL